MSKVLLCRTPDTQLPELPPALLKKEHEIVGVLDLVDLDLETIRGLGAIDVAIIDASCGFDGTLCCKAFNHAYPDISVILLLTKDAAVDAECKVITGGNVLRMPFTPRKVTNRIRKMSSCHLGSIITAGDLSLNLDNRCVYRGENVHRLTPRQAKLLEIFMRHTGKTLTRKFLMETVWETDYMGDTRTLDVHVRWIRERIEEKPSSPLYLRTVRGIGYRFGVPADEE